MTDIHHHLDPPLSHFLIRLPKTYHVASMILPAVVVQICVLNDDLVIHDAWAAPLS